MLTSPGIYMFKFMRAFREFIREHREVVEQMLSDGKFSPEEESIIREVI